MENELILNFSLSHILCFIGSRHYNYSSIKASASDETSSGANQYVKEEPKVLNYSPVEESPNPDESSNGANQYVNEEPDSGVTEAQSDEKSGFGGFSLFKDDDDATSDDQFPQFDFLNKLNMEVCYCLMLLLIDIILQQLYQSFLFDL